MSNNLDTGASGSGSPRKNPDERGESPKKGKVTFNENEIEEELKEPKESEKKPAPKILKKPIKSKYDVQDLDAGLEKLKKKFGGIDVDTSTVPSDNSPGGDKGGSSSAGRSGALSRHPWHVDPSLLTIGSILGNGSYGTVYKGQYKGKTVAIKMLEWGNLKDHDEGRKIHLQYQFFREVEVMYKLESHPNVCKMLGATLGSTNFMVPAPLGGASIPVSKMMCCIIMEFMAGGTLRQFWISHRKTGNRRMPFTVMLQFSIDIAEGLAYLHSKKVCHRDLKPDNILLAEDCVLKIADFGVSRALPTSQQDDPMSLYTGTPNYSAPEILQGKNYNYKCDVYSYGICIWEIYTCNVPYPEMHAIDSGSVNNAIIHKNLRPKIPCCCPAEFKMIMTRCWDSDPLKRPEMAQVVKWLSAINTKRIRCNTNETIVETCACMTDTYC